MNKELAAMPSNRQNSRQQSAKLAFCGLMVALSVVLMLSGGLIPVMTYCAPMMCGVFLLPIFAEYGKKAAWTAFAATAVMTLILGTDKEAAFFYIFFGYYPILKWSMDRIKKKPLRLGAKLLMFNLSFLLLYAFLGFVLHMDAVLSELTGMGTLAMLVFGLMFNACMLLYDRLLFPLLLLYAKKLRPRLGLIKQ